MPHIDEGNLHALLDGALVGDAAAEARAHLQLCANCRTRLEDAESIRDQADAILGGALPAPAVRPDFEELVARARAVGADPGIWPAIRPKRIAHFTAPATLAWAASLVLALAGGWWAHELNLGTTAGERSFALTRSRPKAAEASGPGLAGQAALARAPGMAEPVPGGAAAVAAAPAPEAAPRPGNAAFAPPGREGALATVPAAAQAPTGAADRAPSGAATVASGTAAPTAPAAVATSNAAQARQLAEMVTVGYGTRARTDKGTAGAQVDAAQAAKSAARPAEAPVALQGTVMAAAKPDAPQRVPAPAATTPTQARGVAGAPPPNLLYTGDSETRDLLGRSIEQAPTFTPYTVAPELLNRLEVERALTREYPGRARDEGRGGRTLLWLLVDDRGLVQRVLVKTSSGDPAIDAAAMRVGRVFRFSPALNVDRAVWVWVQLPITFRPDGSIEPEPQIQPQPQAPARTDRPDVSNPVKPH